MLRADNLFDLNQPTGKSPLVPVGRSTQNIRYYKSLNGLGTYLEI